MSVKHIFEVGQNVKKLRKEKGISQKRFAELLEIPVSTLANYEAGRREIPLEVLQAMPKVLHCKASELLPGNVYYAKRGCYLLFDDDEQGYSFDYSADQKENRALLEEKVRNDDELLVLADFRTLGDLRCEIIKDFVEHYKFHHPEWKYPNLSIEDLYKVYEYIDFLIYENNRKEKYNICASSVDEDGNKFTKEQWEEYYFKKQNELYVDVENLDEVKDEE